MLGKLKISANRIIEKCACVELQYNKAKAEFVSY